MAAKNTTAVVIDLAKRHGSKSGALKAKRKPTNPAKKIQYIHS